MGPYCSWHGSYCDRLVSLCTYLYSTTTKPLHLCTLFYIHTTTPPDPNTKVAMYESADICQYLVDTYGDGSGVVRA